jgi:hypothetical protein
VRVWLLAMPDFAMPDFAMLDLAVLNKNAAQLLDDVEQGFTTLLDKNAAQQYAERANITAEGKILGWIGGARSQLSEPAALVIIAPISAPKRRVTHSQS